MSANLTSSTVKASFQYAFQKAVTGFGNILFGPTTVSFSLAPSTTVANNAYVATISLAASATVDIDLVLGLDPFGVALAATKVVGIYAAPTGTGSIFQLEPGASNGLPWFMLGTTPSVNVPAGGIFSYCEPAGHTVDSTHKILTVTNTGSTAMTCPVVILVKT